MRKESVIYFAIVFFFAQILFISSALDNLLSKNHINCAHPRIIWEGEISKETIKSENSSFFKSLVDVIFGSDELNIVKPFSVISINGNELCIIDQESQQILIYSRSENQFESLFDEPVLKSPVGLCAYSDKIAFTDSELNSVLVYDFASEEVSTLNSSLQQPTGIIYLEELDEFWVCETRLHRIARLDSKGNLIGIIGERGTDVLQFNYPTFIWKDKTGKVYINDSMNFRIQILSVEGRFISSFGKNGDGSGDLARPKGIATDSFNNIYIVDALFNNVQVFDQEGKLLYVFGERGFDREMFSLPAGIFIDNDNKIYIADSFNSRIQIFQLDCGE